MEKILILTDVGSDNLIAATIKLYLESNIPSATIETDSLTGRNYTMTREGDGIIPTTLILSSNLRKSIDAANIINVGTANTKPLVIINVENLTTALISRIDYKDNIRFCSIWSVANDLIALITKSYEKIHLCSYNNNWIIETLVANKTHPTKKDLNSTEQEIVRCAKAGMSIKETAQALNLSVNTIAAYRTKITRKLGYPSMRQLCADNNV